jgi:hypothetical protein
MDAMEFLSEAKRMCDHNTGPCETCAANEFCGFTPEFPSSFGETTQMQKMVEIVEMWSKEHPRKTRQDKLLEQWPNAQVVSGVLQICPKSVMGTNGWWKDGCGGVQCCVCRREFWMQEVE